MTMCAPSFVRPVEGENDVVQLITHPASNDHVVDDMRPFRLDVGEPAMTPEPTTTTASTPSSASAHVGSFTSSYVLWIVQWLHDRQLLQPSWYDVFQHCMPVVQHALANCGFSERAWSVLIQPSRTVSRHIVRIVTQLKHAVFTYVRSLPHVTSWIVGCFVRRMYGERVYARWVKELLEGLHCADYLANRLTVMGTTSVEVMRCIITGDDDAAVRWMDDDDAPAVSTAPSLGEGRNQSAASTDRRRRLMGLIRRAVVCKLAYERCLHQALVRCLLARLLEDETITSAEYAAWTSRERLERLTRHLQHAGCTSYGLCWFVLGDSLDLRKTPMACQIRALLQSP